ncbi:vacuole effluxer Atg22 like-domain-containing protein [Pseudomassariella vexata]|uniref:Autophagy-related protein n=1 Tax=Pseudomassariella vexata TaxID=1141098 RepID=A0A1Y2E9P4_9PEZI|nr:vacuole effluxer Atg22 like-domain-containing protein [Pseudomassariella vexata]ORY68300.1 vacuole effluxer Atg22 like-domain-containing protein [Pseudomassariella vexata]
MEEHKESLSIQRVGHDIPKVQEPEAFVLSLDPYAEDDPPATKKSYTRTTPTMLVTTASALFNIPTSYSRTSFTKPASTPTNSPWAAQAVRSIPRRPATSSGTAELKSTRVDWDVMVSSSTIELDTPVDETLQPSHSGPHTSSSTPSSPNSRMTSPKPGPNMGYGWNNVGFVLCCALSLAALVGLHADDSVESSNWGYSVAVAICTGFWILLAIPWFLWEKKRPGPLLPKGDNYLTFGFRQACFAARQAWNLKQTFAYLVVFFLLADGVGTTITLVMIVQTQAVVFSATQTPTLSWYKAPRPVLASSARTTFNATSTCAPRP